MNPDRLRHNREPQMQRSVTDEQIHAPENDGTNEFTKNTMYFTYCFIVKKKYG